MIIFFVMYLIGVCLLIMSFCFDVDLGCVIWEIDFIGGRGIFFGRFDLLLVESIVGKNVERLYGLLLGRLMLMLLNGLNRFYDVEVMMVEKMIEIFLDDFGV